VQLLLIPSCLHFPGTNNKPKAALSIRRWHDGIAVEDNVLFREPKVKFINKKGPNQFAHWLSLVLPGISIKKQTKTKMFNSE
jgi:hypothetical protein